MNLSKPAVQRGLTVALFVFLGLFFGSIKTLYAAPSSAGKHKISNARIGNAVLGGSGVPAWSCGDNIVVHHTTADNVSPVNIDITYGTVSTAITGTTKCWITRNLGATTQASSATDNTDASAGWYWQFNLKQGYAVGPTPAWTITAIDENLDWDPANDPCTLLLGAGWRLPTSAEWTSADGAPQNWANYNDTYASVLKLHAAGYLLNSNGTLLSRGSDSYYWSSTRFDNVWGYFLRIYNTQSFVAPASKVLGMSVRCLKD